MKDPASAQFGRMAAAISDDGVVTVCGFVNGKNSFGGFVGQKPFLGVLIGKNTGFAVVDIASTSIDVQANLKVCRKQGVSI